MGNTNDTRKRPRRTVALKIRLTPDELARLAELAEAEGETLSNYGRRQFRLAELHRTFVDWFAANDRPMPGVSFGEGPRSR